MTGPAAELESLAALRAELGTPPPPGLSALSTAELEVLTVGLRDAKERSAGALEGAAERALHLVPALLRGPVRRVLFR